MSKQTATRYPAADVCKAFGVSSMALYHWTNGTTTRDPLPCTKDDSGRRLYAAKALLAYAKKYGLVCKLPAKPSVFKTRGPAPGPLGVGRKRSAVKTAAKKPVAKKPVVKRSKKAAAKQVQRVIKKVKAASKTVVDPSPPIEQVAVELAKA